MIGVILCAGLGSRLKDLTIDRPKALVKVNGVPLIDYALNFIKPVVNKIIIVGGFQFETLEKHLDSKHLTNLILLNNPEYKEGSILTIEKALSYLDDSFLMMNVDHIYPKHFIQKIADNIHGITGICDFDRTLVADDMKIKLSNNRKIIHIDKKLADYDGGYIGMTSCHRDYIPVYTNTIQNMLERGLRKMNVEYILQVLADNGNEVNYLDLSGSTWLEVDDQQDLFNAEKGLLKNQSLYL